MQAWQDMTKGPDGPVSQPETVLGTSGLARDVELLRCLTSPNALANGMSVTNLAEATKRESSQVSRVMRALESVKLVERDASRRYRIGPTLFALAARSAEDHLYRRGVTTLETLAERIQNAVHLCTLVGTNVRTLATRTPDGFLSRGAGGEEHLVPAHSSSAGRVLLGDFTRHQLASRFSGVAFDDVTPRSRVLDIDGLWTEVRRAVRQGFAIVDEEFSEEWVGASAAVRDHTGTIVAAINATGAKKHWPDGLGEMAKLVADAAAELSNSLGFAETERRLRPI